MKYIIISDIHANLAALTAVWERVDWMTRRTGDGFQLRFLGDLVGYGPAEDALACINWLKFRPRLKWIPGNHDEWILNPNGGMRFEARVTLLTQRLLLQRPVHEGLWDWFSQQVTPFVEGDQPSVLVEYEQGYTAGFTHASIMPGQERGSYLFPWQYSLIERDLRYFREQQQKEDFCLFFGHTHFPMFAALKGDKLEFRSIRYGVPMDLGSGALAINPGSVGQPRDGDPRSSFVLLDLDDCKVTFHRVDYNLWQQAERLGRESNVNKINRGSSDLNHPLSGEERKALKGLLSRDGLASELPGRVEAGYQRLIESLQTGDGGDNNAKFAATYARPKWDLEARPRQSS